MNGKIHNKHGVIIKVSKHQLLINYFVGYLLIELNVKIVRMYQKVMILFWIYH